MDKQADGKSEEYPTLFSSVGFDGRGKPDIFLL